MRYASTRSLQRARRSAPPTGLAVNEYNGVQSVQLIVEEWESAAMTLGFSNHRTGAAAGLALVGLMMIARLGVAKATRRPTRNHLGGSDMRVLQPGVLIWLGYPTLAVMLGVITTMLLYLEPELRGLSQGLTRQDLFSILQFACALLRHLVIVLASR